MRSALTMALLLTFSICSSAQNQSATLSGRVTDPGGSAVVGADVVLTNRETGVEQKTKTNSVGLYLFAGILPGNYRVAAGEPGFKTEIKEDLSLHTQQEMAVNFSLSVGSVSESVTVSAGPETLLQTETGNITTTLTEIQVRDVPNSGNDIAYLAYTSPGTITIPRSTATGFGPGSQFSAFGLPSTSNYFTIDGAPNIDPMENTELQGATNQTLGVNEVESAAVVYNGGAQYGSLSGDQLNINTKSGTNQFHGNARYDWNGRVMNANNFFNNRTDTPRAFDNFNDWAASFGGPIIQNKTFFFVDTEGQRIILPTNQLVTLPSASFQTLALNSVPAAEVPYYQNLFKLYNSAAGASRAQAVPGDADIVQFRSTASSLNDQWLVSGRVDQNLGQNDKLFGHYTASDGSQTSSNAINPALSVPFHVSVQQAQVNEDHVFGTTKTNQLLISGMHYAEESQANSAGFTLFPGSISFGGSLPLSSISGGTLLPSGRNVTQYSASDNFYWSHGAHTISSGIDFRRVDYTIDDVGSVATPSYSSESRADFLAGKATSATFGFPQRASQPVAEYFLGGYVQDQFKARPNLTLTAGLRIEHFSDPVCQTSCIARFDGSFLSIPTSPSTPYNQLISTGNPQLFPGFQAVSLEPRVSFAWSPLGPDKSTVVRGAFGMFSDALPGFIFESILENVPVDTSFAVTGGLLNPAQAGSAAAIAQASQQAFANGFSSGASYSQIAAQVKAVGGTFSQPSFSNVAPNLSYPTYEEWDFGIQQAVGAKTVVNLQYTGNHGYHEYYVNTGLNAFAAAFSGLPTAPLNPSFGAVRESESGAVSNFNGLVATATHRSNYLTLQLNYTWSHALDDITNGGFFAATSNSLKVPLDPFNLRLENYGNSDFDRRHDLSASYVLSPPHWRGPRVLVDNWEFSGTVSASSGFPFSIIDSSAAGALGRTNYGSAKVLADQLAYTKLNCSASAVDNPCLGTPGQYFASANSFGSQRRNQFYGPSYFNTDFSAFKGFTLPWRETKLKVGAQMINALNHPNFAPPASDIATPSQFGRILTTVGAPTSLLGANLAGDSSPRMIELSARVVF